MRMKEKKKYRERTRVNEKMWSIVSRRKQLIEMYSFKQNCHFQFKMRFTHNIFDSNFNIDNPFVDRTRFLFTKYDQKNTTTATRNEILLIHWMLDTQVQRQQHKTHSGKMKTKIK